MSLDLNNRTPILDEQLFREYHQKSLLFYTDSDGS